MLKAAIETLAEENGWNWKAAGAQVLIPFAQHPAYSAIKQLVDAIVSELETNRHLQQMKLKHLIMAAQL